MAAKIIIYNGTDSDLIFKNKSSWYNSTFYSQPPQKIPPKKYGVALAVHDTGEATGVFNQLTYRYKENDISFGTYVPWSWVYTNNVLVDITEINYNNLYNNSKRPSIRKFYKDFKITGEIDPGDNPTVKFTVEKN